MTTSDNEKYNGFEKLEIVKKYFLRIFTILPKDIRKRLLSLKLTKQEIKDVKKELAFLPEEKQREYLDELEEDE
ncbi:MAG: hypothetical protein EAX89_05485 [Candidatus Lokiarchaeota archaeon]|nr:hypothetical protein [Candidatus Lokiarchaeota archaeon]